MLLLRGICITVILLIQYFSSKRIVVNYCSWNVSFGIRVFFFASFFFLSYHHWKHFSWQLLFTIMLMLPKSSECIGWVPTAVFLSQGATSISEIPNWCSKQPFCFKNVSCMKWYKGVWSKSEGVCGLLPFFFIFWFLGSEALVYWCEEN